MVNGAPVTSATPSGAISLAVGPNTISVVVTAQDGTTKTYTITVTRTESVDLYIIQTYTLKSQLAATTNPLVLTITVGNRGPGSVTGAVVNDTFPAAAPGTLWIWTCVGMNGGTCGASSGTGDLNETLGALPMDGSVIFTVTGTLNDPINWENAISAKVPTGIVNSGRVSTVSTVGIYRVMLPIIMR